MIFLGEISPIQISRHSNLKTPIWWKTSKSNFKTPLKACSNPLKTPLILTGSAAMLADKSTLATQPLVALHGLKLLTFDNLLKVGLAEERERERDIYIYIDR